MMSRIQEGKGLRKWTLMFYCHRVPDKILDFRREG